MATESGNELRTEILVLEGEYEPTLRLTLSVPLDVLNSTFFTDSEIDDMIAEEFRAQLIPTMERQRRILAPFCTARALVPVR